MQGQCLTEGLVYQATVTTTTTPPQVETYTGLTVGTFKHRHTGHTSSFRHSDKQTTTTILTQIFFKTDGQIQTLTPS